MTMRESERYPNAVAYIKDLIRKLCSNSQTDDPVFDGGSFHFKVRTERNKEAAVVSFSEERMEDFEEVVKPQAQDRSSYGMRMRYFIDFTVYLALGRRGLIPQFKISEVLLNENRIDWWKDTHVRVALDEEATQLLLTGLKNLETFLARSLEGLPGETSGVKEAKQDIERIRGILDYSKRHDGSLDESAASVRSLSMLKAAAISEIMRLEKEKQARNGPAFAVQAFEAKIYSIVEKLRGDLFLEVPLPGWFKDYVPTS